MAKTKSEKLRLKRKAKQKGRRKKAVAEVHRGKIEAFLDLARFYYGQEAYEDALALLNKALKLDPDNTDMLTMLAGLGYDMDRPDLALKGFWALYEQGRLPDQYREELCFLLEEQNRRYDAVSLAEETLDILPGLALKGKRVISRDLRNLIERCGQMEELEARTSRFQKTQRLKKSSGTLSKKKVPEPKKASKEKVVASAETPPATLPRPVEIPIAVKIDDTSFSILTGQGKVSSPQAYMLAIEANQIRLKESFDNLICLNSLREIRSLSHQEETARKVLKTFRGRALLADEVGLGKTIEACMILKEYLQRGMVKNALILTPTPLVSQWKDELSSKFDLVFASTDDRDFRSASDDFWTKPFLLASINIAKSIKNFDAVTAREYDLVIVDEAHHLKNRNSLNWKLVNALKKRFLLLLTATPVENNLMELYNLVTLLRPGQLKTAAEFRNEFMTRGDPTSPQNRAHLKELLGQVMVRNTRAVARIDLPPRYAMTVRVEATTAEQELYARVTDLVKKINAADGVRNRMLLKNLLAEAGSSPNAVSRTLMRAFSGGNLLQEHRQEILAIGNMCRSMANTAKNKMLLKLITAPESPPGKKIVFVKYTATLEHLAELLDWERIPYALFHGRMENSRKEEEIKSFMEQKDVLLTTEVGGEGRNLQFCHQMINYDLPWNPMKIEQRIGRIHRIGQQHEVLISNLCAGGSIEDYILQILDKKINMFEMVIGEIDMILGRIRGEQDFSNMVFDIWVRAATEGERESSFADLALQLQRSKAVYQKTKALDEKLFGEQYEL